MSETYVVTLLNGRLTAEQQRHAVMRFRTKLEHGLGSPQAVRVAKLAYDRARATSPKPGNAAIDRWLNAFSAAHFHALADRFHEPVEFRVDCVPLVQEAMSGHAEGASARA